MSDDATKTDPPVDPPKDDREKAETEFWGKLKSEVSGIIDEKLKTLRTDTGSDGKPNSGESRTGHRQVNIKTLIADLVYGPPKD